MGEMGQIPQAQPLPQLGNIQASGIGAGLSSGFTTGTQLDQGQQALNIQKQQLAQQQHKEQVESALQLLATTGQQIQYLRPSSQKLAISNSLNALAKVAPEFGIQPHTPDQMPDESIDLMKSYAKLHEGYLKGEVSAPTFQTEGQRILTEMSLYERNMVKENANILGDPKMTPGQANGQPAMLNQGTGQVSDPQGKPMPGAQGGFVDSGQAATLNNEKAQSLGRTFLETTKDQQQTLPDLVDFTTSMAPRLPPNATDQDKSDLVAHQKIGLLKYMQMQVPASRRPPNLQAMDSISKEDLIAAHAEQAFKRLFVNGAPLSDEMQESILKNGVQTGLTSEARLSDAESSWANSAKNNGVDPTKAFQNLRPSGIPSTSKLFPGQGPTAMTAHVGQIVVGKSGAHIYRGGDRSDPKNWTAVK